MNQNKDKTKQLLEEILSDLYKNQAKNTSGRRGCYLLAQDNQFLGYINTDIYDNESILNKYGPYGSEYSPTSIFNSYSQYGSEYGTYSINNPYSSSPPKLFVNSRFYSYVTDNQFVSPGMSSKVFLYNLNNNIDGLINGDIVESEIDLRTRNNESFIVASDGIFLGSLNNNHYDNDSIFNQFSPYGNKFSPQSIFNRFGTYGGQFSQLSPFNKFSNTPPKIYLKGELVGHLSKNIRFSPRIDPDEIKEWAQRNVNSYF